MTTDRAEGAETVPAYNSDALLIADAINAVAQNYEYSGYDTKDAISGMMNSLSDEIKARLAERDAAIVKTVDVSPHSVGRRWRHVKRGTEYVEVAREESQRDYLEGHPKFCFSTEEYANLECSIQNGQIAVFYRGPSNKLWSCEQSVFEDGRFVEIVDAPSLAPDIAPGLKLAIEIAEKELSELQDVARYAAVRSILKKLWDALATTPDGEAGR